MDELRHPQTLQHPPHPTQGRRPRPQARPTRLGQTLQEAREDKGLELRDLAALTNVRVMHLEALETGDFHNLPADPYGKNFVRLYAQAVGLEPSRMLLLYGQERRSAAADGSLGAQRALELPSESRGSPLDDPRLSRILRLLATLLLITLLVLTGLWLFNRTITPSPDAPALTGSADTLPTTNLAPSPAPASSSAQTTSPVQTTPSPATTPAAPQMVLLSLRTTPPGAEVSIDGYSVGSSPLTDAPVQAGTRAVRVTHAGYRPYEERLELSGNRRLNVTLTPVVAETALTPPAPAPSGQITLTVTEEAWLEIYEGSTRNEGTRLVYETAPPGATYTFDAPVYVFSGNAGGIRVEWKGQSDALGEGVSGRAYRND